MIEPDECPDPEPLTSLRQREHIVIALSIGQSRWPEVLEIITGCDDTKEAGARLAAKFDLDQIQATALLDMQFRRVNTSARTLIDAELTELRARIAELTRMAD